jgi:ferredoxin
VSEPEEIAVETPETGLPVTAAELGANSTKVTSPESSVRGERWLARVDAILGACDTAVRRYLPDEINPLAQAGRACNFAIVLAVVSGVLLLIWYSPSLSQAYASIADTQGRTLGGWVRAVHRYSSDFVMLFALLHAARMFFARKFGRARWVPWASGIGLLVLIWFIGWTGYWLVWDQPAQQVAVTSMRLLDMVPIFGEPMGRLYVSDRTVPSLLFFVVFFLHMLLPLAIAVGLAVHLLRVNRIRLLPNWRLSFALAVGVGLVALIIPAPLDGAARMGWKAESFTVDAWYLSPLAITLRFQHAGPWLALAAATAGAMALPWVLGRRRTPVSFQTQVDTSRCHGCTQCVQDCPFDAVRMIDRADGKRFASQAWVDPSKCVGCAVCVGSCDSEAMSLTWFDTRREEARIHHEVTTGLADKPRVAFVAGDIDSGFALFRATLWRERLPDYQVHFVPTASWVRPKFVERLLASGVQAVLVVRDAKAEAAARDGNRWVKLRFSGERKPVFRPERARGSTAAYVLDYDGARAMAFTAEARAIAQGEPLPTERKVISRWKGALVAMVLGLGLSAAAVAPSRWQVRNPTPAQPEFVFSFKALGERQESGAGGAVAEDPSIPIHMRGRSTEKPHREPVVIRLTIDGVTQERTYQAKGISRDGPALDQWRQIVAPGAREVMVEVITGPRAKPQRWSGRVDAQSRQITVLTYEPQTGFRVE